MERHVPVYPELQQELSRYLPRNEPPALGAVPAYRGTHLGRLPKETRTKIQGYLRRCSKVKVTIDEVGVIISGDEIPEVVLPIDPMVNRLSTIRQFQEALETGVNLVDHYLNPYIKLVPDSPNTIGVVTDVPADPDGRVRVPPITIPACYELFNAIFAAERDIDPA